MHSKPAIKRNNDGNDKNKKDSKKPRTQEPLPTGDKEGFNAYPSGFDLCLLKKDSKLAECVAEYESRKESIPNYKIDLDDGETYRVRFSSLADYEDHTKVDRPKVKKVFLPGSVVYFDVPNVLWGVGIVRGLSAFTAPYGGIFSLIIRPMFRRSYYDDSISPDSLGYDENYECCVVDAHSVDPLGNCISINVLPLIKSVNSPALPLPTKKHSKEGHVEDSTHIPECSHCMTLGERDEEFIVCGNCEDQICAKCIQEECPFAELVEEPEPPKKKKKPCFNCKTTNLSGGIACLECGSISCRSCKGKTCCPELKETAKKHKEELPEFIQCFNCKERISGGQTYNDCDLCHRPACDNCLDEDCCPENALIASLIQKEQKKEEEKEEEEQEEETKRKCFNCNYLIRNGEPHVTCHRCCQYSCVDCLTKGCCPETRKVVPLPKSSQKEEKKEEPKKKKEVAQPKKKKSTKTKHPDCGCCGRIISSDVYRECDFCGEKYVCSGCFLFPRANMRERSCKFCKYDWDTKEKWLAAEQEKKESSSDSDESSRVY